jgi:hypothetical protein
LRCTTDVIASGVVAEQQFVGESQNAGLQF